MRGFKTVLLCAASLLVAGEEEAATAVTADAPKVPKPDDVYEPTAKIIKCVDVQLDPENEEDYEYCQLAMADVQNNMEVHRLLEKGHSANTVLDYEGRTPLIMAALAGNKEIIAELVNFGSTLNPPTDVNIRATSGHSAVMYAAGKKLTDIVEILCMSGADTNFAIIGDPDRLRNKGENYEHAKAKTGYTALHFAASHGSERLMKILLDAGANANAKDHFGVTPLDIVKRSGQHPDVIESLVKMLTPETADSEDELDL